MITASQLIHLLGKSEQRFILQFRKNSNIYVLIELIIKIITLLHQSFCLIGPFKCLHYYHLLSLITLVITSCYLVVNLVIAYCIYLVNASLLTNCLANINPLLTCYYQAITESAVFLKIMHISRFKILCHCACWGIVGKLLKAD